MADTSVLTAVLGGEPGLGPGCILGCKCKGFLLSLFQTWQPPDKGEDSLGQGGGQSTLVATGSGLLAAVSQYPALSESSDSSATPEKQAGYPAYREMCQRPPSRQLPELGVKQPCFQSLAWSMNKYPHASHPRDCGL